MPAEPSAAQGHEWGPWVSDPVAFNGDPNRICSCGLIQWLGSDDPHTRPHDVYVDAPVGITLDCEPRA